MKIPTSLSTAARKTGAAVCMTALILWAAGCNRSDAPSAGNLLSSPDLRGGIASEDSTG